MQGRELEELAKYLTEEAERQALRHRSVATRRAEAGRRLGRQTRRSGLRQHRFAAATDRVLGTIGSSSSEALWG